MNKILTLLLLTYLAILPFGEIFNLYLPGRQITIRPTDLMVAVMFLIWISGFIFSQLPQFPSINISKVISPINKPLTVFILIALLSLLQDTLSKPLIETLTASLYLFRWITYASLFPITIQIINQHPKNYHKITQTLIISFTLIAILGWIQYFFFPDLRPLANQGWDPHYYRLTGTFLDPGFIGIILIMGIIYIFPQRLKFRPFKSKRLSLITYHLLLITFYLAIAFTYSRAAYLSLITATLTWTWFTKSRKMLFTCVSIFILTWIFLPRPPGAGGDLKRTSTIEYRLSNYQQTINIITDNPLLGVGFNRLRYTKRDYQYLQQNWQSVHSGSGSDNSFLFVMATTGIIGLTAYLWLWINILKSVLPAKQERKKTIEPSNNITIFTILIAVLTHTQFNHTLFYPPVMALTWIMLALNQASNFNTN